VPNLVQIRPRGLLAKLIKYYQFLKKIILNYYLALGLIFNSRQPAHQTWYI